jgi:hypothetical protein
MLTAQEYVSARRAPLTSRLVALRAAQRTFEGAYVRTALAQLALALAVLRLFTAEFAGVGALFGAYGAAVLALALYRRWAGASQAFGVAGRAHFRTRCVR